jgi:hypothetical protein
MTNNKENSIGAAFPRKDGWDKVTGSTCIP